MRHKSERIILDLPQGSSARLATEAASLAYRFACDYPDRPAGRRHAVLYDGWLLRDYDAEVWWTAGRAVSVLVFRWEDQ